MVLKHVLLSVVLVDKLRVKNKAPVNRPWTVNERLVVLENSPPHIRLPIALAMCAGLRKADVFSITTSAILNGYIAVKTSKRGVPIRLPIHPILASALADRPNVDCLQIAVRSDGKPWTPDGFDTAWHKLKKKLEYDGKIDAGLTLHGLRHTLGTLLKEAGASDGEIADVLGQSTISMARHYSKEARISDKLEAVVMGLELVNKHANPRTS
jgi:integrase